MLAGGVVSANAGRIADRGIRINQAGYFPDAPKVVVIDSPPSDEFEVRTIGEDVLWKCILRKKLVMRDGCQVADFSEITRPGDYCIVCGTRSGDYRDNIGRNNAESSLESYYFVISPKVYDPSARLMVEYFLWQRCGSDFGWAGKCHQDPVPLVGTGRTLDMRGGYHQSCDLRCWADGISMSLIGLLRYAEKENPVWDHGRLDEELQWGCDYFVKLISPDGFLYDSQFVPIGWGPRDYYNTPSNLGAHCNAVVLLAGAARRFAEKQPGIAAKYREGAEKIYRYLDDPEHFRTPYTPPVKNLPRGTQGANFYFQNYRDSASGLTGRIAAALAMGDRKTAFALVPRFLSLQTSEGWFREADDRESYGFSGCSYTWFAAGVLVLFDLLNNNYPDADKIKESLRLYAVFEEKLLHQAGFSTFLTFRCKYGDRENRISPNTSSARAMYQTIFWKQAARIFNAPQYREYAQRCFDWVWGANPEEASYITGVGYNHKRNPVFGQFYPSTPQIPGGVQHVMNGEYDMPSVGMALWAISVLNHD